MSKTVTIEFLTFFIILQFNVDYPILLTEYRLVSVGVKMLIKFAGGSSPFASRNASSAACFAIVCSG